MASIMTTTPISGFILAGGQSTRMGRDKALLDWHGTPLLNHMIGLLEQATDDVKVVGSEVTVHFHLTSPLCPSKFATSIGREIRRRVEAIPGVTSCEVVLRDHFLGNKIQELINTRSSKSS